MKKVNTNKVTAGAVANQAKANKIDLTTIQLYDDISVTIETKTLDKMKSWAFHTYRDLSVAEALDGGIAVEFTGYTEDELNQMIVDAGLQLNLFDPNDDDRYVVTGANVYESCMGIISICKSYIDALHKSIESDVDIDDVDVYPERKVSKADPADIERERKMSKAELDKIYPWPTTTGKRLEPAKPSRKPGRISTVKTMSEGLKYTETDEYDDF